MQQDAAAVAAMTVREGSMKKRRFSASKEVRKLARERVGTVRASRPIEPKARKQPKHKKPPGEEDEH
jgi:hypothetical protein